MTAATRSAAVLVLAIATALVAAPATARESGKRYGIRGIVRGYDAQQHVFHVAVTSDEAPSFGGSTAGGKAPSDVAVGKEMDFLVKPEGTVLSRTVIKSTRGTGLDLSGTEAGFQKAVALIPNDRPVVLSIEKNPGGTPAYRIQTVFIPLTDAEIAQRIKEFTEGKDGETPAAQ
jgi:hypothetical protein